MGPPAVARMSGSEIRGPGRSSMVPDRPSEGAQLSLRRSRHGPGLLGGLADAASCDPASTAPDGCAGIPTAASGSR